MSHRSRLRHLAPCLIAGLLALPVLPTTVGAAPSDYAASVMRARALVQEAMGSPSGVELARQAAAALRQGAGETQPEILAELERVPPDLSAALARLDALAQSLGAVPDSSDPAHAQQELHRILSQSRYSYQHQPPSFQDQLKQFLSDQWTRLRRWLDTGVGAVPGGRLVQVVVSVLFIALIVALVVISGWRGRGRNRSLPGAQTAREVAADHFTDADRLAAAGDYVSALRSLAHAVATSLSGRPFWDTSPLTLRELFSGWQRLEELRPLLLAFEAAVYGHQPPDQDAYQRAASVAARYRAGLGA